MNVEHFCDYCQNNGHNLYNCSNDDFVRFYHLCTIKLREMNHSTMLFSNWLFSFYHEDNRGNRNRARTWDHHSSMDHTFYDNKQIMKCFANKFCLQYHQYEDEEENEQENEDQILPQTILNYILFKQRNTQTLTRTLSRTPIQQENVSVSNDQNNNTLDEEYYLNYYIPPFPSFIFHPFEFTNESVTNESEPWMDKEEDPTIQTYIDSTNIHGTFDCPICFDHCTGSIQVTLQCNHNFCASCQIKCFEKQIFKCSMCRTPIEKISVSTHDIQELITPHCKPIPSFDA